MSFSFKWPRFSEKFHADTMQMLDAALNRGNKPPIIEDKIEVVELEMGTQPPELEIRDIGDLTMDQFRGIFKLSYSGDAHIVLRTKVQANPLHHRKPGMDLLGSSRGILAAHQPLVVPMLLRLSNFKLNAYVVLVVSKQKGITLVFKTDPLQNVDVNSTFDSIAVIQKYIQKEIEGQLRDMFREDLPGIIHKLSQRWIPGNTKIETPYLHNASFGLQKDNHRLETMSAPGHSGLYHVPIYRFPTLGIRPQFAPRPASAVPLTRSFRSLRTPSRAASSLDVPHSTNADAPVPSVSRDSESSFPDLENYDPTYGMRPEGLPSKSAYGSFGRLWTPSRGLGDLAEESIDDSEDGIDDTEQSFDMFGWDESRFDESVVGSSVIDSDEPAVSYETIPAVGGGTITRPRVYHSQSLAQHNSPLIIPMSTTPLPLPSQPQTSRPIPSSRGSGYFIAAHSPLRHWIGPDEEQLELGASAHNYDPHRANSSLPGPSRSQPDILPPPAFTLAASDARSWARRSGISLPPGFPTPEPLIDYSSSLGDLGPPNGMYSSPESSFISRSSSGAVTHSPSTPPSTEPAPGDVDDSSSSPIFRRRKDSISHSVVHPFEDTSYDPTMSISHGLEASPSHDPLRPGLNSTAQLSTLSHSNHTLSPFTRSVEHFTVRSVPHLRNNQAQPGGAITPVERQPVKAKRKRTFRIGRNSKLPPPQPTSRSVGSSSPIPLSPSTSVPSELSEVDHYFADSPISRRRPSFNR